ncbi:MAG: hypothetical protein Q4A65_08630 [Bacillota bacterium]|nr:hypothetical protein [Bacillota bacterium]
MSDTSIYMDMHAHIIPGVDDGSQSIEESIEMMRQAYQENIRVIIATPHFGLRNPDYDREKAERILDDLRRIASEMFPDLHLFMGNELYYSYGILESLLEGKAKTLAGTKYVLVEFSPDTDYSEIRKAVNEFTWNGYWPIIAHAERCSSLTDHLEAVRTLVDKGAYIQVNCRSFLDGGSGAKRKRFGRNNGFYLEQRQDWSMKLLNAGLVHFIASDCHSSGMRKPIYQTAVDTIIMQGGEKELLKITKTNILGLIRNERI